jgi:hypothetical protein
MHLQNCALLNHPKGHQGNAENAHGDKLDPSKAATVSWPVAILLLCRPDTPVIRRLDLDPFPLLPAVNGVVKQWYHNSTPTSLVKMRIWLSRDGTTFKAVLCDRQIIRLSLLALASCYITALPPRYTSNPPSGP